MRNDIPTYQLSALTENSLQNAAFFVLNQTSQRKNVRIDIPYRSQYYKIGICRRGSALVKADLETYEVKPDCLIIMSPHIIKQWTFISSDFDAPSIFFTEDFLTGANNMNLRNFPFFDKDARQVFQLFPQQALNIAVSLGYILQKDETSEQYRDEIVKSLLAGFLFEIAAVYDARKTEFKCALNKSQTLAREFKKLASAHFLTERSLQFYADKLSITPKHLTAAVRKATGKTAGEWLAEAVILEAKVLMQNPQLNVSQISDMLDFSDQSAFGKFFKKHTGLAPSAYQQSI